MLNQTQIQELSVAYLSLFPDEEERIKIFTDYINRTQSDNLYDRKNFDGHITTSAFIINRKMQEILLLKHKSLNRWLQPGGHVEQDKTLLASALREAEEETGIPAKELINISIDSNVAVPFDIDPHFIPANPKKMEAGHYHHDIRYLFSYEGNGDVAFNEDESTGLKWVPFTELKEDDTFGKMIAKFERFL